MTPEEEVFWGPGPWYAECAHGSDDRASCFGCKCGVMIGPLTAEQAAGPKRRKVRYAASFVQNVRDLTGNHRWPLRGVDS